MANYNKPIGVYGEDLSTIYLINKGYKILEKNYRTRFGEIDIIAKIDDIIIFIEIKSRYNDSYGSPIESVTKYKQRKILSLSRFYLLENRLYYYNARYDVIEVILNHNNDLYKINHIEDAFRTY